MSDAPDLTELDPGLAEVIHFQRDLYLYWSGALEMGAIPLTTRGLAARPALRRLVAPLGAGGAAPDDSLDTPEHERPRVFFLRRALERLNLLRLAGEGGVRRLEPAEPRLMARYLDRSLAERVSGLARLWASGAWWSDHPESGETPGLQALAPPRVARARRRALDIIAIATPGVPIELAPAPPTLERLRNSPSRRDPASKAASRLQARQARMIKLTGGDETLAAALAGPLNWLGLVRWDDTQGAWIAGLPALALRPAGAEAASEVGLLIEPHGRVVAQSDLTLIAYAPLTAPALFTLDLLAMRESLDHTARYRLSRQAFARARALGWDAAQATAQLERLTGDLPGLARAALADWERAASRLRLTADAILLEVPTSQSLDALLADRAAATWVLRRLTPTAALLHADSAPQARLWLLRHGHLPAMVKAPTSDD